MATSHKRRRASFGPGPLRVDLELVQTAASPQQGRGSGEPEDRANVISFSPKRVLECQAVILVIGLPTKV